MDWGDFRRVISIRTADVGAAQAGALSTLAAGGRAGPGERLGRPMTGPRLSAELRFNAKVGSGSVASPEREASGPPPCVPRFRAEPWGCVSPSFIVHSAADGHVGCFQTLACQWRFRGHAGAAVGN